MNKKEFTLLNALNDISLNIENSETEVLVMDALNDKDLYEECVSNGLIKESKLTAKGLEELEKYRVDNAIILAAGPATRFIPLSLEMPKGLYEVRGESLIERQIKQLHEVGIKDITVVLGYKQEMYFYLKEKYDVKFAFNNEFNIKNNIQSIYASRKELKNTYICNCDSYYTINPFHTYEYDSFCAGYYSSVKRKEVYVEIDEDKRITGMSFSKSEGNMLLGHSFWKEDFSNKFIEIVEKDKEVGKYDSEFWEWLVEDNLDVLPPIHFKEYKEGIIFEFDYFDELREFDEKYLGDTHSKIMNNITSVFNCGEEEVINFRNIDEGLTNTSIIFAIDGVDYIYRHPGDGTESIINRANERTSLEKAKELGIDPTYIYMDIDEGWKISKYVPEFKEPDYVNFEDSKRIIKVLRDLHASNVMVDYGLTPYEDACEIEKLLKQKDKNSFNKFEGLKKDIHDLYESVKCDGVRKCFCHGDTYKHNWMLLDNGDVILIDWEYSGYSDPGIDVGYYIIDAMYELEDAKRFIKEYLGNEYTTKLEYHYLAYSALIAYYWFVWAMYRESCGAIMGESLYNWYDMAKSYVKYANDYKVE